MCESDWVRGCLLRSQGVGLSAHTHTHTHTQLVNTIPRCVCEDVIGDSIDEEGRSSQMRVSVITGG